jgi:hypothetical protein
MKNNSVLKVMIFFVILIFSVGLISAEDNNFTTLQKDIDNSTDEFNLEKNYKYNNSEDTLYKNGVIINKNNFIINGNNYIIDGNNEARMFNITGNNVTIKNINLINGYSMSFGGSIHNTGNNIVIINSNLTKNTGNLGGAIYNKGDNFILINSNLNNNIAGVIGGAIFNEGNYFTITHSNLNNNNAKNAGAIYNYNGNNFTITHSILNNNTALFGGAIYNDLSNNFTITHSILTNNKADTIGSLIYNVGISSSLNISYSILYNNTLNNTESIRINAGFIILSNNFWGSNNPNFNQLIKNETNYTLDNYVQIKIVLDSNNTIIKNSNLAYHITITNNNTGNNVSLPQILVNLNGNDYFIAQDNLINGSRNITANTIGNFTAELYYYDILLDSFEYEVISNDVSLNASDIFMYYYDGTKYVVSLKNSIGNPIANQTIIIRINGVNYTRVTDENGTAYLTINLAPNVYNITSYFNGSSQYNNASITTFIDVESPITGEDLIKYYRNESQYHVSVVDRNGNALANVTVRFNINGVFYTRTTNSDGIATLNINLNPGNYVITATYDGLNISNNITVLATITGENIVKYYKNGTQYTVTILDKQGNPLANSTVNFNVNGVFYNRTTDSNGVATLNINLNPGNYIITATGADGLKVNNTIKVLQTLIGNDVNKTFTENKTYNVLALDGQGNPLANQNITINIHGVFYYKMTDSNGTAKLNINLNPGNYIATATWNGYSTSNTIKVE